MQASKNKKIKRSIPKGTQEEPTADKKYNKSMLEEQTHSRFTLQFWCHDPRSLTHSDEMKKQTHTSERISRKTIGEYTCGKVKIQTPIPSPDACWECIPWHRG